MSSSDRRKSASLMRAVALACAGAAMLVAAGCTVTPLYGTGDGTGVAGTPSARLASVSVGQVNTREAQEVRNHLIFLLNGGAGDPASPAYLVELSVTSQTRAGSLVQIGTADREPTSGEVQMTAAYVLKNAADGTTVAEGRRIATAAFDRPRQEFAVDRAERDAQNRAARELAEMLRLALATDLAKG